MECHKGFEMDSEIYLYIYIYIQELFERINKMDIGQVQMVG